MNARSHFAKAGGRCATFMHGLFILILVISLIGVQPVAAREVTSESSYDVSLVASADTWLRQGYPTRNYGGAKIISVSPDTAHPQNSLFRWDLSSIPAEATVTAASLIFYVTDSSAYDFYLFNLRRAWVEGTSDDRDSNTSANWDTYDGKNGWGAGGAQSTTSDRYNTDLWDATKSTFGATGSVTIDLNDAGVAVVQGWVDGTLGNYGLTVQRRATSGTVKDYWKVASREATDEAQRPKLNVIYTLPEVNQAPTGLSLSADSVAEKQPIDTVVGTLATTDPDAADTHTYTLVSGEGDTDNDSFNIEGAELRTAAVLDYEAQSSYSVRIRTTDQGGLYYEQAFTITVEDVNQAPTGLSLSADSVAEKQPIDTVVGTLATTDPDAGDTHTYTLVSGVGDTDNDSFNIEGAELRTADVFDHEAQPSYSVRIRTTDQGGLYYEKAFTITVGDVNEAPTGLSLSADSVAEKQPIDTVVGTLATTDPDAADTHTYTLVSGTGDTDNDSFNIQGAELRTADVFDYEAQSSYSVRIRTTDQGGLYYEKAFTITVTDVEEAFRIYLPFVSR